jgi:hypothetical protein
LTVNLSHLIAISKLYQSFPFQKFCLALVPLWAQGELAGRSRKKKRALRAGPACSFTCPES